MKHIKGEEIYKYYVLDEDSKKHFYNNIHLADSYAKHHKTSIYLCKGHKLVVDYKF
jgi:hypothetical protein